MLVFYYDAIPSPEAREQGGVQKKVIALNRITRLNVNELTKKLPNRKCPL